MSDLVEQYQAQTESLAAGTVTQVAAIWAALQAGQIATTEAEQLIAAAVATANAAASTLADAFISAQIEHATGNPTPTVGLSPRDDTDRLTLAARTILDDLATVNREKQLVQVLPTESPVEPGSAAQPDPVRTAGLRFERLAHSEPLETAQQFSIDVMAAQPLVEGWTRQMDADPCQLCRWWWREGRIWPKAHPFQSHKGCNCQPKLVLAEHIPSTEYTRKLERNQA
ncbi:hypothetical protein MycrhDRAFT_1969 [Mycolicibacterium rhodesiae JS60]|nr:hypothetical protein MycrhDRAFT_1969 [Mycolicibacterium rhodesiae JS60]